MGTPPSVDSKLDDFEGGPVGWEEEVSDGDGTVSLGSQCLEDGDGFDLDEFAGLSTEWEE
jgi:hypothetical protein